MKLPFSGGCLCGALRYECTLEPELMYYCHCSDCRKASGTAFHAGMYMKRAGFDLIAGTPKSFAVTADSGRTIVRYFCPACGSHIYSDKGANEPMLSLKAGSLDDPDVFRPDTEIWTLSKTAWANLPENLTSHLRGPVLEKP